jgi:hypothetical protein
MLVLASIDIGVAGIVVGGLVTLGVAGITAVTTNRRQREALKHDRELFDLADLRKLLDEAAVALDRATPEEVVDLTVTRRGPPVEGELLLFDSGKLTIEQDAEALDALHARLSVRLSPRDDITLALGEFTASLRAIVNQIPLRSEGALDAQELEARSRSVKRAMQAAWTSAEAFMEAAVERVGTVANEDDEDGQPRGLRVKLARKLART